MTFELLLSVTGKDICNVISLEKDSVGLNTPYFKIIAL